MNVAVVGCGVMGSQIARRLQSVGHAVFVWNRDVSRLAPLADEGAIICPTPAGAASQAQVVITMVSDDDALHDVSEGATGLCAGLRPGSIVLQMATVSPGALTRLAEAIPAGVEILDAPVLGSVAEAEAGSLHIFAGGSQASVQQAKSVITDLGHWLHVGDYGSGTAAKLVANSTLLGCLALLGESISLALKLGLRWETAFEVLSLTPLAAQASKRRQTLETQDFPPRFSLGLARKDAEIIVNTTAGRGFDLKVATAVRRWLLEAEASGFGASDYTALLAHIVSQARPPGISSQ